MNTQALKSRITVGQTIPAGWLVGFGGAVTHFESRTEARRYAKDYQKQVAARGGKFKPTICRALPRVIDTSNGTTL